MCDPLEQKPFFRWLAVPSEVLLDEAAGVVAAVDSAAAAADGSLPSAAVDALLAIRTPAASLARLPPWRFASDNACSSATM